MEQYKKSLAGILHDDYFKYQRLVYHLTPEIVAALTPQQYVNQEVTLPSVKQQDSFKQERIKYQDMVKNAFTGSSIMTCKCGGDMVLSNMKQTRSADEGLTAFLHCSRCSRRMRL